jgi:predicted transposase YdaD
MEPVKGKPPKGKPGAKAGPAAPAAGNAPAKRNIAAALGRKTSRKMAREMLLLETRRLRAVFSEIAERYLEETEGRIAAAISGIETKNLPQGKVEKMLELVQTLSVKSRKGRRKDLARIEKLTQALLKNLEE